MHGVYRGKVTNVMDFGCFVELLEFRQKFEGLVHVSMISTVRGKAVQVDISLTPR